jgi:hypothetical protein
MPVAGANSLFLIGGAKDRVWGATPTMSSEKTRQGMPASSEGTQEQIPHKETTPGDFYNFSSYRESADPFYNASRPQPMSLQSLPGA